MQLSLPRVLPGDLIHNFPLISLIFANLVTIVLAIIGNWDLATVLFIYWAQSIIIGIFTVVLLSGADTAALAADLGKPIQERGGLGTVSARHVGSTNAALPGSSASTTGSSTGRNSRSSWSPGSSG